MTGAQPGELGVIELRRYLLRPGQRDVLIELFDREFIEPQEAVGMTVLGQFRDDAHPDTFTWLRGFTDMQTRRQALTAFYGGTVWARHRNAANATMIDSDNVRLLTPAPNSDALALAHRAARGDQASPARPVHIVTYHLARPASPTEVSELGEQLTDRIGAQLHMLLTSLHAVNDFPALPIREGENAVVAVLTCVGDVLDRPEWDVGATVFGSVLKSSEVFCLRPTDLSRLR
jgi:NIPSNAP